MDESKSIPIHEISSDYLQAVRLAIKKEFRCFTDANGTVVVDYSIYRIEANELREENGLSSNEDLVVEIEKVMAQRNEGTDGND